MGELDMECRHCGAKASSEWTWVEWWSDDECSRCHDEEGDDEQA